MGHMAICVVIFDYISNQSLYLIYLSEESKLRNCEEIKSDQVYVYLTLPY